MLASIFGFGKDTVATCEVCGKTHIFDSFECAIQALAPTCAHCGCRIIGHGIEANGVFYCCAHCADQQGVHDVRDRGMPEREQSRA